MRPLLFAAITPLTLLACGSDTGSESSTDKGGLGSTLNDAWDLTPPTCTGTVTGGAFSSGDFSVVVADGEISRCANASAPAARAQSLPEEIELRARDTVVTSGAESYRFELGGHGFHTSEPGAVTIQVPFDTSKVPEEKRDALHVFLRVHLSDDENALVDVNGTLDGGFVRAELRGLPASMNVAVIYNPDMAAVLSTAPVKTLSAGRLTPTKWGAHAWCAVYNPNDQSVIDATAGALGLDLVTPPTLDQIAEVARTRVAQSAANAQDEYESQGFRQPDLYIATTSAEPCGGTDPRFSVHWVERGNKFTAFDPAEVIGPDRNPFGRLYVSTGATNWTMSTDGATVLDVVAHEILHAIQAGYTLWGISMGGYKEASSTCYGHSLALGSKEAEVRSRNPEETFLLSNFLMLSTDPAKSPTYSSQDFIAFVARSRNGGSPGFLTGLFQSLHDAIESAATAEADPAARDALRWQPPRSLLLRAMDSYFVASMDTDLRTVYLDFLRERAFAHGPNSSFGRTGERQDGFASELFPTNADPSKSAVVAMTADPDACTVQVPVFELAAVAPLASRVLQLTPTAVGKAPVAIHIKVDGGGAGTAFGGSASLGKSIQALENETVVSNFGKTMAPLYVAFANLDLEQRRTLLVRVSCEAMTDSTVELATSTWPVGYGEFTVHSSVTGPGLTVGSDETTVGVHIVQLDLATKMPATLGLTLDVTPPPPADSSGVHSVYEVTGYTYQIKEPQEHEKVSTGTSMSFALDSSTTKGFGAQLFQFSAEIEVKYRITSTFEGADGTPSTTTGDHSFTALSVIAYVNVP